MPDYFFHVSDGRRLYRDDEAVDLPDIGAAQIYARQDARDLVCQKVGDDVALAGWRILVCDPNGRELLSVPVLEWIEPPSVASKSGRDVKSGNPTGS
ncbi:hypothetical protein GTW51_21720 [Aurantimonas aggregata]|uniref:DUF6894 domain-containing protein n=1 Tax=Aurantimonas aggregata TaxID=2047720 RepID=A0A6L9MMW3_9HYPH|nr:hypothetical protein [Aurantimonas aggregata]NDV89284.1 hypothetical protein [Aurantimonas aggregata]